MSHNKSLAYLLGELPLAPDEAALFPLVRQAVADSGRQLVVIDDDPTGIQTVHNVALLTEWDQTALAEMLRTEPRLFFLLTNSRSVVESEASRINLATIRQVLGASRQSGVDFVIASRSDSTLRGHYPAEITALHTGLAEAGRPPDGHLLVPAFFEGGRYTINNIHYVATPEAASDTLTPADQTPFAADKVFGYRTAYLPAWVEEKSRGGWPAAAVGSLSLELIRKGGPDEVARYLNRVRHNQPVIVNAAGYGDLAVVALGLLQAEAAGKRFLYRTAAGFVRVRGAVEARPLLTPSEILGEQLPGNPGGLVIVGSYVPGSSAQLENLLAVPGVEGIELVVQAVLQSEASAIATSRHVGQKLEAVIKQGRVAVLFSSRGLVSGQTEQQSLEIGRKISEGLVRALDEVVTRPRFIIAKGGITSHVVAQRGLGAANARAIGQILPGVPVWRLESGPGLRFPGVPYVVFPGNVGGPSSLAGAVRSLTGPAPAGNGQ